MHTVAFFSNVRVDAKSIMHLILFYCNVKLIKSVVVKLEPDPQGGSNKDVYKNRNVSIYIYYYGNRVFLCVFIIRHCNMNARTHTYTHA